MLPCKSSSKSLFSAWAVCFKTFTVTVKLKVQRFSTYSPPTHMLFSPWPSSPTTVEYLFQSIKSSLTHHILPKFIVYIRDPSCGCTFYESGQNYHDKETSLWYHRRVLLPKKSSVVCLFIASLLTLWTVTSEKLKLPHKCKEEEVKYPQFMTCSHQSSNLTKLRQHMTDLFSHILLKCLVAKFLLTVCPKLCENHLQVQHTLICPFPQYSFLFLIQAKVFKYFYI